MWSLPTLTRIWTVALAAALTVTVCVGCGVEHSGDGARDGALDGAQAGDQAGDQSDGPPPTAALLLTTADLPTGFTVSGGQNPAYRQTVCGVDIEPSKPTRTAMARFSQGPLGPFVEQRVRVYADDSAATVVKRLRTALATCDEYDLPATDTAPAVSLAISPLQLPQFGDESVAWRQVPDTDLPITTDVVLIRSGRTVVLITSYALKEPPPSATVEQAATAAAQRLA